MNSYETELETVEAETEMKQPTAVEALFAGDSGALPLEARRLLVHLLAGPFLDGKRHTKLWQLLQRYESSMRCRLAELFLELVVDPDQQVAFTRPAGTEELDVPSLLRKTRLTFMDSVLMLYLRQLLTESDTHGERAAVSDEEIHAQLALYEKAANTDRAGFKKRITAAIENAKDRNILIRIGASKDRYEISPVLKLLFSAEQVIALQNQYRQLLESAGSIGEDAREETADE